MRSAGPPAIGWRPSRSGSSTRTSSATKARAIVGRENFRLPIPLVKGDRGWVFDGKAGVVEMNEQRVSVNEANDIRALRALARAQEIYREKRPRRRRGSAGTRGASAAPKAGSTGWSTAPAIPTCRGR